MVDTTHSVQWQRIKLGHYEPHRRLGACPTTPALLFLAEARDYERIHILRQYPHTVVGLISFKFALTSCEEYSWS